MMADRTNIYVQHVIDEVPTWGQITTGEGSFKSDAFKLGSSPREIDRIHRWGAVDIGFLRSIRSLKLESTLYQVNRLQHTCDDRSTPELAEIDVEAGLQDVGGSNDLRTAIKWTV